jgi:3-oxoacyl-[acyl-carrier protein] reductase
VPSTLIGKVIAITGASAGIGRACAERLARDGAIVVLSARRAARLDDVARIITDAGGQVMAVVGDVTSPDDMRALVERAVAKYGRLDVMICNAGIGFHGSFGESTPEITRRLFDVNVLGTVYAAKAAYDQFARQNSGHIIAMSSVAGIRGGAGMSLYSATKAAQIALIESLRSEFIGTGLHASVIFPASAPTEFRDVMRRDYGYAADGSGLMQSVESVAESVARCIESPRAEVYPQPRARWLALAAAIAPAWADRYMRKHDRRKKDEPEEPA